MILLHVVTFAAVLTTFLILALIATFCVGLSNTPAPLLHRHHNQRKKKRHSSPPLRVGFLHPDFGIGGAENLVMNAALALQQKGASVTIFTAHHNASHCFEETRGNGPLAHCVRVHGDWLPRTIFGKCFAFCAMLRILYVTLVIAVWYANTLDLFFVDQVSISIPFLRVLKKPVLFYGHYPDKLLSKPSTSKWKQMYRWPLDFLEEITTVSADAIFVNSKFTRQVFYRAFPRLYHQQQMRKSELGILYPPVDVNVFETFHTMKPRNPNLFVSLNRFERKKNIALAVHALAELQRRISKEQFESVKLIIAGGYDPNNKENIEHLKELKAEVQKYALEKHVEFRTSVSDTMKKELLMTAQAILYTPSNEHFGIVPVEAMICGTPVIAVNSGGPLESVVDQETGFLCESSFEAFADAMAQLCGEANATKVAKMGTKGKEHAKKLFSLETFADSLYEIVENLVV